MKALLVIDMQKISFTPKTPRFDTEGVIERINLLSASFRAAGDQVIFVQHDGTKEGVCIPETEEWEILDSLIVNSSDLIISKSANDAFYQTTLKAKLLQTGINELVVTGCATDFCVDATIKSALVQDFSITVIADGHTTADRQQLDAKGVTEFYNWIWHEMTPTKGRVEVIKLCDYLENEKTQARSGRKASLSVSSKQNLMTEGITYNEYQAEDFESLLEMSQKLWKKFDEAELKGLLEQIGTSGNQKILMAKGLKEENAGFAIFSIRKDYVEGAEKTPTGYLEGIYVETDYRKKGIAKRFMQLGEEWLKDNNCTQIGSDTWLTDTASRSFHKKVGFWEEEELVHFLKNM